MAIGAFSPVAERTLQIASSGVAAITGVWQPAKDPQASSDYWLDASLLVAQNGNDVVASVAGVIEGTAFTPPATLTMCATDGTMVLALIAGGVNGDNAIVDFVLTFASGRTYVYAAILPIRSAALTP